MIAAPVLRLLSADYDDMLTDAGLYVLAEKGASGLTIKALAGWLGVTPPAVSQRVTRDRMLATVAGRFADRWIDWLDQQWRPTLPALLPVEDPELVGARSWPALQQLGRCHDEVATAVGRVVTAERVYLDRMCADDDRDVGFLGVVLAGVRSRVVDLAEPLTLGQAHDLLQRAYDSPAAARAARSATACSSVRAS